MLLMSPLLRMAATMVTKMVHTYSLRS